MNKTEEQSGMTMEQMEEAGKIEEKKRDGGSHPKLPSTPKEIGFTEILEPLARELGQLDQRQVAFDVPCLGSRVAVWGRMMPTVAAYLMACTFKLKVPPSSFEFLCPDFCVDSLAAFC
ncbi:hypothetical protein PAPYR_13238 [Paratrimastix pyriformis]|uniref:Uncharacterized protein n=1 Tax=Paratrimastix pyriformis TaxID=342808 RepID=A0ABQ8U0K0_9EUKA|nr:hypothetical protein PAPYR_13238 [Paratrimastix pyriformis]